MLPDRCSVTESKRRCVNPPEFIVSVLVGPDEYMVGVACGRHREKVAGKVDVLQRQGKIPAGKVRFSRLRAVGTDCVRGSPDVINIEKLK